MTCKYSISGMIKEPPHENLGRRGMYSERRGKQVHDRMEEEVRGGSRKPSPAQERGGRGRHGRDCTGGNRRETKAALVSH